MLFGSDWGWAPEYVQAMWLMMQLDKPDDFVIATGRKESLKYFVAKSFEYFDLDWQKYVEIESSFFRPNEIHSSVGNPEKAIKVLGWNKPTDIDGVIKMMCAEKARSIKPN